MTFSEALQLILEGRRLAADFLPQNMFIEVQRPDANSMNTEPYLKLVAVQESTRKIVACEPWEPGRRSIFSNQWRMSQFDGLTLDS